MKRMQKKPGRVLAGALAAVLILTSVSIPPEARAAGSSAVSEDSLPESYEVSFDGEDSRGGWKKAMGDGTLTFHDGQDENGYAEFKASGNTVYADSSAPKLADGYVEMKITNMVKQERFAIVFRYQDAENWQGFGFDAGTIRAFKGDGYYSDPQLASYSFADGQTHVVRIEYTGNRAVLYIDGQEKLKLEDAGIFPEQSGTVGIRTWGYDSGDTQGTIQVDYVKAGTVETVKEVSLNPGTAELDYASAGSSDISIGLSDSTPALMKISRDTEQLVRGEDYTVDGTAVTIQKEYIQLVKENAQSRLTFEFENGYTTDFILRVRRQEQEFIYSRNFADGLDGFEKVSAGGTLKAEKNFASMEGAGIFIDQNSRESVNNEVEFTFNPKNVNCSYGVILRYVSPAEYLYVGPAVQSNQHFTRWGVYNANGKVADINDAGFIMDNRETPYKVKVRVIDNVVTVFIDNEIIYSKEVNNITVSAGKVGFCTTSGTGMNVYSFTQSNAAGESSSMGDVGTEDIQSSEMTVSMDKAFPRVVSYTLAGGASTTGQEKPVYQVEVNNRVYNDVTVTSDFSENRAVYTVEIEELGVSFDTAYTVTGNVLEMKILNINDSENKIYTINFPEQSMVSMSSKKSNAQLRVNNYEGETKFTLGSRQAQGGYEETTLAVLSADDIAAALSGKSYKNRKEVAYKTTDFGDHTSTGLWLNEFTYRGLDGEVEIEEPWVKASVVGDINLDGRIDYQDGAVALRDLCLERKTGADEIVSTWPMIAMNVGSEAQYPFLRILDNIKKVNLATDGFGQNVIIKGYQSEGHDASHPDFANYNKRAGGLEDFKTLLENSEDYNAKVGVHINHTDIYPESPQFKKLASSLPAWYYYDSSQGIVRENDDLDQSEHGLDGRLAKLFDKDTENQLDTVYVDVFFGTRWPLYKLVSNINDRDMALGTEYVDEMVSYSAFAHHIGSDFGGAGNLVRFVDHNQADIFTSHKLFRGANSRGNEQIGIDGWQGAKDLNIALTAFYTMILPNKYLAHFPVMQYENDNRAVLGADREVVTEMVNGVNVITKDGKKVAEGNKLFIPWDPEEETKIYHYNPSGGSSVWELPDSWAGVKEVTLYELSEKGRALADTLQVSNGKVTINGTKAGVGYVLYKKSADQPAGLSADTMEWSTGSPVKDMGFDSYGFSNWKKDSSADHIVIQNNNLGNAHLYMKGKQSGEVKQELSGLVPGQSYSASVWAATTDGRKAAISVDNGGEVLENYTTRSNVMYGYHHSDKSRTFVQRVSVRFTAKAETAVLSLTADACEDESSIVDFDDVRVMKCNSTDPGKHKYLEDFENVDQGLGIFTSTDSDHTHLSQMNLVNPEVTPDVIDGLYSLKVREGDYLRTLPSTVRLLPNTTYTVGLDYKSNTANSFKMGIKSDKAREAGDAEFSVLAAESAVLGGLSKGSLKVKFTTGDYDDYYIDITKNAATEYFIDNVYVDEAKPMTAETLTELAVAAGELRRDEYTPESYDKVQEALQAAQSVLAKPEPGREEIIKAYQDLEAAIEAAVKYAGEEEKKLLSERLDELSNLLPGDYVQDIEWLTLQAIIEEARELQMNDKGTAAQVMQMMQRLDDAKGKLTPTVDRSEINAVLKKAEAVQSNDIVDGKELQSFLSAFTEARNTNTKPGVTAGEVRSAAEKLQNAYDELALKEESKVTLLTEALKKTEIIEAYFRDEDLSVIREAKAELIKMRSQTGIMVKDYYAVIEKLDHALGNKQDRPVLSDSMIMDPSGFKLECDNQNARTGNEGPIELAFDQNPDTIWHSNYTPVQPLPATILIDMGTSFTVNQFSYLCRPSGGDNGKISSYDLFYQDASGAWGELVTDGTFKNDLIVEKVKFAPITAQKLKFVVKDGAGGFGSAAELAVYKKVADMNELQNLVSDFVKLNRSLYTEKSFSVLEALVKQAEAMLKEPDTPQSDADALRQRIEEARNKLELLPTQTDMRALEKAIEAAKAVKLQDYKNTGAFEAALIWAEKLFAAPTTQKEVKEAAMNLVNQQNALVKAENPTVLPTGITLDKTSVTMKAAGTIVLNAVVLPLNATDKAVTWSSSNPRVAEVRNGGVTALSAGTANITAATRNGLSASCTVTVTAINISDTVVGMIAAQKHTGREIRPQVKITYGNTALRAGIDYRAAYKNNRTPGTATVIISGKGQYYGTRNKNFTITAAKGKIYTVQKGKYKVLNASLEKGCVSLVGPVRKNYSSFTIKSTIKIGSYHYKVTEVGKNAFKSNKKLKKVVLGSNIRKIGAYAFYNTKNLKNITINSKVLKSVGKDAVHKINGRAIMKVPGKKRNQYRKIFRGKGLPAEVKFIK